MIFVLILFVLLLVAGAHAHDYRLSNSIDFGDWRNFIPSLIRVRDELWNLQLAVPSGEHRFIVGVNVPTSSIFTPETSSLVYMALAYQRRAATDEKNDEKDEKKSGIENFYITQIGTSPHLPVVTPRSVYVKSGLKKGELNFSLSNVRSARRDLRRDTLTHTWYDVIDSDSDIIRYDGDNFVFDAATILTFKNLNDVFSTTDINHNWRQRQQLIEYFALVFAESIRNHQVADTVSEYLRFIEENGYSPDLNLRPHQGRITDWDKSALRFFNAIQGAYSRTPELFVMQNLPRRSDSERIDVEQCLSWHYWTILNNGTTIAPPVTPPPPFTSTPCGFLVRCDAVDRKDICTTNGINPNVNDPQFQMAELLLSWIYFDTSNIRQGVNNNARNAIALLSSSVINVMMHWIRETTNRNRRSGGGGKKKGLSHSMQILSQTPSPVAWSRPLWSTAFCITRNRDLTWSKRYAADVNGDGRMDVVFISWQSNQCRWGGVLLSNGDGTFQDAWCFPFYTSAWDTALFIGDVNGDDKSDLILQRDGAHESCEASSAWSVYLGQSNGTFSSTAPCALVYNPSEEFGIFQRGTSVITIIDMNNDGKADLLFHTNGPNACGTVLISYSKQEGSPAFFHSELQCIDKFAGTSTQMKVTPMDVNGDGITDLFFQVSTSYAEAPCPAGKGGVYLGELNEYGKTNFNTLVCMDWNMDPDSVKITPLDVNSDGKSDLLIQIKRSSTTVSQCRPGQGGIYLASQSERIFDSPIRCIPVGLDSEGVVVHIGDVNGDGWKDLVLQTHSLYYTLPQCDSQHQGLMTMYGYGNGTFIQRDCKKYTYNAQWSEGDVLLGDVNRDGRDDIVFRDGSDDCPHYIQRAAGAHGLGVLLSTAGYDEQLN